MSAVNSTLPRVNSSTALTWVYPQSADYALREYQVNICKQALLLNTLVCLPTGLGKTLIAAVVMYNYYRWFPEGKVIFMAPTKPLVNQQIAACYNIMGIPENDIAHLEGSVAANKRESLWRDKRVFFCTPQTLMNDLSNGRCDARKIVCVVIDEAHRATGQYAYSTVIQEISSATKTFRVLALSATPGSDSRKVQTVINNLLISHIEIRAEDDPEIVPFTHLRQIDVVVCTQGTYGGIQAVRKHLNILLQLHLDKLNKFQIVDCESAAALNFLHIQEAQAAMQAAWVDGQHDLDVLYELNCAVEELGALLRCRKVLCDEGFKSLLEHLQRMKSVHAAEISKGHIQATHSVVSTEQFQYTVELITRACADPKYLEKRQPKLSKLKEILSDHFARHGRAGSSTRALVFSQLRSTVHEIKTEIGEVPGIKAHEFVGQGTAKSTSTYNDTDPEYSNKGLTQADQARILRAFNDGEYNVLVATSIAEEGLDIAEVDLIVLFEAVSSPIRLVQRCGRTGRKRSGKVVMLVSQGLEEDKVEKSHDDVSVIAKALRNASKSMLLYAHNPAMLPRHLPPPQMVLQDMQVATFRPGEVAGGLAQMHKSSSSNRIAQESTRSLPPQTKIAHPEGHVGRSTSSNQLPFSSILDGKAPAPTTSTSVWDCFADEPPVDRHTTYQNVRVGNNGSSRTARPASNEDADIFGWGLAEPVIVPKFRLPEATLPRPSIGSSTVGAVSSHSNFPRNPIGANQNLLASSSTSVSAVSHAHSMRGAATTLQRNLPPRQGIWGTTSKDVEIVDLLEDSPLRPLPTPSSAADVSSVAAVLNRTAQSKETAMTVEKRSSLLLSGLLPPSSQAQSQSQGASQGGVRLKNIVRSTSRAVSFFPFSDDESVSSVSKPPEKPAEKPCPVLGAGSSKLAVLLEDSPASQVVPAVKRRVPKIMETQDNFGSQCTISDVDDNVAPSPHLRNKAIASAGPSTDLDGDVTADSEAESDTDCDDEQETADWRDTANACCACLDWRSEEEDPIVFCDGLCGSCIHVSCYGLLSQGVPEGDFFCEGCAELRNIQLPLKDSRQKQSTRKPSCGLCFRAGGLVKRGTCGTWAHPVCVLFTPELTICPDTNRPDNITSLNKDRKYITCELCRQHGGACVQCAVPECLRAFHPFCAYTVRQQMIVRIDDRTGASSYELYCPKHKENYATEKERGEIVSSRISLVEDKLDHAEKHNQGKNSHRQVKTGVAYANNKDRSTVHQSAAGSSLKSSRAGAAVGSSHHTPHEARCSKSVRFGGTTRDADSPGDLVDTDEKPPRGAKNPASSGSMLELISKSRVHPTSAPAGHGNDEGINGNCSKRKRRHRKEHVEKFFEMEAALSGSDSGDESGADCSDTDSCLSGTFINDGAYTQQESQAGAATQYGMYLAVDNYHMQMASPDAEDFVQGKVNIAALVRGPRGRHALQSPAGHASILPDTPCTGDSNDHRGYDMHDYWRTAGKNARTRAAPADTPEMTETASSSGESSEDEVADFTAPVATASKSNIAGLARAAPVKSLQATGKENQRSGVPKKASFLSKILSKSGAESRDDSDFDAPPNKKRAVIDSGAATTIVDNASRIDGNKGSSIEPQAARRPPLCPMSPNVPPRANDLKVLPQSPDIFGWQY